MRSDITLTADTVVFRLGRPGCPEVLLVRRRHDPFAGCWALPGGHVEPDERLIDAAARELQEETGVRVSDLREIGVFDAPERDPRGRTVTVAFCGSSALPADTAPAAADDAEEARFFPVDALPELAFDHAAIIARSRAVVPHLFTVPGH